CCTRLPCDVLLLPWYLTSLFCLFLPTSTSQLNTLSLHDALPISNHILPEKKELPLDNYTTNLDNLKKSHHSLPYSLRSVLILDRSEEHTSELQSRFDLVCRLLLEIIHLQLMMQFVTVQIQFMSSL